MKHIPFTKPTIVIGALLAFLVVGVSGVRAQTLQECKDELVRTKAQRDAAIDLTEVRERRINSLTQQVTAAERTAAGLEEKVGLLNNQITELKKQIAILEDNVKLTGENAQMFKAIAEINKGHIEVQKAAIEALMKTGKRSAVEKFVDSLPSIAGIIAVALTRN